MTLKGNIDSTFELEERIRGLTSPLYDFNRESGELEKLGNKFNRAFLPCLLFSPLIIPGIILYGMGKYVDSRERKTNNLHSQAYTNAVELKETLRDFLGKLDGIEKDEKTPYIEALNSIFREHSIRDIRGPLLNEGFITHHNEATIDVVLDDFPYVEDFTCSEPRKQCPIVIFPYQGVSYAEVITGFWNTIVQLYDSFSDNPRLNSFLENPLENLEEKTGGNWEFTPRDGISVYSRHARKILEGEKPKFALPIKM